MTDPGELDKVPIKVVPIYLDPVIEDELLEPEMPGTESPVASEDADPAQAPRIPRALIGVLALLGALATAVLTGVGTGVAANGMYDTGAFLAWIAVGLSGAVVILALAAIVFGRGRWWGVIAAIIAILANPWVLTSLLGLFAAP